MPQTLEERVDELEKKVSLLLSGTPKTDPNDWQQTFGLSKDDHGFDEIVRLGRQYRENLNGDDQSVSS